MSDGDSPSRRLNAFGGSSPLENDQFDDLDDTTRKNKWDMKRNNGGGGGFSIPSLNEVGFVLILLIVKKQ